MIDRKFEEITQDDYYRGKRNGPASLVNEDFKRDHEIYNALVSFVKGKYFLSYSFERKIYKGVRK